MLPPKLLPIGRDRFLYEGTLTWFELQRDGDGRITAMRLYQDGEGEGAIATLTTDPLPGARPSISLTPAQQQRLVGRYAADAMQMRIFLDGAQLKTQLDGQPAFQLHAETADRLFLTVVDATLEFSPASGPAQAITLRQGEAVVAFKRVAE